VRAAALGLAAPGQSLFVVAAGKAAWPMACGLIDAGARVSAGIVAGPRAERGGLPDGLRWLNAGHPDPDATSVVAGARALALAAESRAGRFVVLLSGGASSMMALPAEGLSLADKVATARALMRAGAPIAELNCVRKHVSAIKGGRLAAVATRTMTLAISDVHGPVEDDPAVIGSGPTVADPTTFGDALQVVRRTAEIPASVVDYLARGARGALEETPKPGDPRLGSAAYHVLANRRTAMDGAASAARAAGYRVVRLDKATEGEAREAGLAFASTALRLRTADPLCVVASGETTVRVRGTGRGGRNQEFALGAAPALRSAGAAVLASVGTDGIDGPTDAAGAIVDPTTESRAEAAGLSIQSALERNDTYPLLARLNDLVLWGPTGTNVGDLHVLLIA
jgi:glycerate 2-kinase